MARGNVEINGKIIGHSLFWTYGGPHLNMKDGVPLQTRGGKIVVSSMSPFIPPTREELKDIKFYYGNSGRYLKPDKLSHIFYKGQGIFLVQGSMEECED